MSLNYVPGKYVCFERVNLIRGLNQQINDLISGWSICSHLPETVFSRIRQTSGMFNQRELGFGSVVLLNLTNVLCKLD